MDIADQRAQLRALGAQPDHVERVLRRWVQGLPQDSRHRRTADFLAQAVRAQLPAVLAGWSGLARLRETHADAQGAARLLVDLHDGQAVECVLLPRDGVCVSTQVGCAVGCRFCMTGQGGLLRQMGSAEIVAQVVLARTLRPVHKVVFMGMGEPAHNLAAVLDAIDLLGTEGQIGHKNLVFSTVGDARVFDELPRRRVRPALALSLHSTLAQRRAWLLPRAPAIAPDELVARGEAYARLTSYPIQYQWTLMAGVNDDAAEIDGIVRLLRGKYAVLNLIPYNSVPGTGFARPAWAQAEAMARALHAQGVLTKLRDSAGQDVEGGCGQLRARAMAGPQPVTLRRPVAFPPAGHQA